MLDKHTLVYGTAALMFAAGCVLLWRLVLRPDARVNAARPLPFWNIPGYIFALSVLRLLLTAFIVQWLILKAGPHLFPAAPESAYGKMVLGGFSLQFGLLAGVGVAWILLHRARFQEEVNRAYIPAESLP